MAGLNQKPPNEKPNVVRLRNGIDHGHTKDKVRAIDPAAAPVGTDEEAAGTPPTAEQIASAAHAEMARVAYERNPISTAVIYVAIAIVILVTVAAILWTQA